jgi:hypothetical protein
MLFNTQNYRTECRVTLKRSFCVKKYEPTEDETEDGHIRSVLSWRKSTYSNPNGECVEVAERDGNMVVDNRIYVRDSKRPNGAVLSFTKGEWRAFIAGAQEGEFDIKSDH